MPPHRTTLWWVGKRTAPRHVACRPLCGEKSRRRRGWSARPARRRYVRGRHNAGVFGDGTPTPRRHSALRTSLRGPGLHHLMPCRTPAQVADRLCPRGCMRCIPARPAVLARRGADVAAPEYAGREQKNARGCCEAAHGVAVSHVTPGVWRAGRPSRSAGYCISGAGAGDGARGSRGRESPAAKYGPRPAALVSGWLVRVSRQAAGWLLFWTILELAAGQICCLGALGGPEVNCSRFWGAVGPSHLLDHSCVRLGPGAQTPPVSSGPPR